MTAIPFVFGSNFPSNAGKARERGSDFQVASEKTQSSTVPLHLISPPSSPPKILLVTSAWHMRRALLLFRRYAPDLDIIPAACDYEATIGSDDFNFLESLLPSADALLRNSYMLKEYIGYWGYKYLR